MSPLSTAIEPPRDLTMPAPGSTTVRALLSATVARAMQVAAALQPARVAYRASVWPALRLERGLLAASLLQPSRMVRARLLGLGAGAATDLEAWADELALGLGLDAAEAAKLPHGGATAACAREVRLVSERRRLCLDLPRGARVRVTNEGLSVASGAGGVVEVSHAMSADAAAAELERVGGRASRASVPLWGSASLVLEDTNPLAGVELHPDKSGSHVDLGGKGVDEWVGKLREAFEIIDRHLPEVAEEMRLMLRHVVPVGYFDQRHLSASYLEAIGVVYVSLHPNTMTLVEALVHEFQHNKLNLLLGLDRVLENGEWPLFSSPVRPDPRPLRGVLLAVHAFQPVARLYERLCEGVGESDASGAAPWLRRRLGEIARLCHEGCGVVLPNGAATSAGRALLDEITALDGALLRHVPMHALGAGGELP